MHLRTHTGSTSTLDGSYRSDDLSRLKNSRLSVLHCIVNKRTDMLTVQSHAVLVQYSLVLAIVHAERRYVHAKLREHLARFIRIVLAAFLPPPRITVRPCLAS